MAEDEALEPDIIGDAPHPRMATRLFGQQAAEAALLEAWAADRLHHAWLIAGPRGVGKATLAYRIACARLAAEDEGGMFGPAPAPTTLDVDPDHPVARRVLAGAEPRLHALTRTVNAKTNRLNTVIRVDDVRAMKGFFQLSSADGGWRVAIVDAADEMNGPAQNALLKLLEEPPPKVLILLVAHAPNRLLPTIRSRCRRLSCAPLEAVDLSAALQQAGLAYDGDAGALATLAMGSVGEAVRLIDGDGPTLFARLVRLAADAPGMNRPEMIAIAEACAGREAELTYDMTVRLIDLMLSRLARAGALGADGREAAPTEAQLALRLAPDESAARIWAELAAEVGAKISRARMVNLDPAQVILDTFFAIDAAAARARARAA
ncbi:MAG: DNA polymerase III subunit delta' [Pseudomonadota bacterium]